MGSSVSTLPWIWVIEALASFKQVDASILIDLVKRAPEIPDNLGKNAREEVSLRILETFFARESESSKSESATDSKIKLDPSEHCEDVVRRILHEIPASNMRRDEPEMFKWDAQSFTMHKRAFSSKCTLQQLKDAILDGNHQILASLKERSGLSIGNQSGNRISVDDDGINLNEGTLEGNLSSPTPEKLDGLLQDNTPNRTLLCSKRDRSDLDTEDLTAKSPEDGISMDNLGDSRLHNAKKLKQDATFIGQAIGQKYVAAIGNELSEDIYRRNDQHTTRDGCYLEKSSHVGGSEESTFSEDSLDHYIVLKRDGQRNDEDASGLHPNNPQISGNNDIVPQDSSGDGQQQDLPANKARDDGMQFAERKTSYATPIYGTRENNCSDEAKDKSEKSQLNTSNSVPPLNETYQNNFSRDTKDDSEHNPGREMSSDSDGYQDEKNDLSLKKQTFLSSQCTFSQDSLTAADYVELKICKKCNKGGQLLVCSGSGCPLMVHQSCLGSAAPSFDDSGRFYCPFCTYSHAISEYLELKKKASLARSDLAVFVGLEKGHRENKHPKSLLRQEKNQLTQLEKVYGNSLAKHVNEINSSQYEGHVEHKQQVEPSVSRVHDNLPCQEEGATINDGTLGALLEREREVGNLGQQIQSQSVLKDQRIEEQVSCDDGDHNSTCRAREIGDETKGCAEDVMQKEVSLQDDTNSSRKASYVPKIHAEGSYEEENEKSLSCTITLRRRENQEKQQSYPEIPHLRRKKVSWTSAEEETLKEGIRRFSSIHDRIIPWKQILEFGSDMFQKGRTTIDLKDKWRNICKGSPKSK